LADAPAVRLPRDTYPASDEQNLEIFKQLEVHKTPIETAFEGDLDWQDLPDRRACRIRKVIEGGYRSPQTNWPKIHDSLVHAMIRLDNAMRPFVQNLKK
jgi:hypothetical protein